MSDELEDGVGEMAGSELARLRTEIERLDRALVELIAERVRVARAVGETKRAAGRPTLDPPREAAVIRRATEHARSLELPEEAVREIFWHIIGLSRRVQADDA